MRKIILMGVLLGLGMLTGCASTQTPNGSSLEIGSSAWKEWVNKNSGVMDAQGHGPDIGSDEWCQAVHFRLFAQRVPASLTCNKEWNIKVDQTLRSR